MKIIISHLLLEPNVDDGAPSYAGAKKNVAPNFDEKLQFLRFACLVTCFFCITSGV